MKKFVKIVLYTLAVIFVLGLFASLFDNKKQQNEPKSNYDNNGVVDTKMQDSINAIQLKQDSVEDAKWKKTKAGKIFLKHPEWEKWECENVVEHKVWIGMTYEMLFIERGKPNRINTSNYGKGNEYQACWDDYDPSCFYFGETQIIKSYN